MTTRPFLLMVHGWGFGSGFWRPLRHRLGRWEGVAVDLGFFGQPNWPALPPGPMVAVGHSLGFLWLLKLLAAGSDAPRREKGLAQRCVGLVSINGFARFAGGSDFPAGVPPRLLQRMRQRLPQAPEEVLETFRRQSGWAGATPCDAAGLRLEGLAAGLGWLAEWDGRPQLASLNKPVLALASVDDAIVPPALSETSFAALPRARLHWQEQGGHLLPLTRPEVCASVMREFLDSLAP